MTSLPRHIWAHDFTIMSPDRNLQVSILLKEGTMHYHVSYKGVTMLEDSPLGMITNVSDFSRDLGLWKKKKGHYKSSS